MNIKRLTKPQLIEQVQILDNKTNEQEQQLPLAFIFGAITGIFIWSSIF